MTARTRALAIPIRVKDAVYERDEGCCVWCGFPGQPNAHFIARAQSGLGIEENVLTLCLKCHRAYDFGTDRRKMREWFSGYLSGKYPDWDEKNLTYRK